MDEDDKITTANYKKYTTILNEVIEGLTRIQRDLSESLLQDSQRLDAKFKAAVVSLKCIDRKYRTLLFNEEPLCIQCTSEYLESKKKEREAGKEKLQAMRKEYYMQEEHMSKLSHALQEAEKQLAMQSIKCTHEGLLVARLLWTATKPRSILEKLTSECATQLNEFLNLAEGCIYAFAATYKNSTPDSCTDEYQYVISLCGILTNLSSIPEGRLFLMWNPFGRAIYTMGLDMMRAISAGSLKWMILIMVYNILVNPLGRKFILKHPLLRENLEGCLLPSNCGDITGTALHIIKIFVDDFIEDNDMVSVLMYQLPLKQVYSLSNCSSDINIRKIALAIVARLKKKMLDCRKAVAVGTVKRRKQRKFVTVSVMTSKVSLYSEYETEDTQYTNSETDVSSTRKKNLASKPYTRKLSKKAPSINVCEEMCATPSLRAKGTNKITVKTLFKPSTSKSLNVSCVELRARSTGRLEGVPPLKQKSKSAELLSASQNKLINVDRKTVISMLSKLDLDTYLRPSYDGFGIPLKNNDCPYCCKQVGKKTGCACKKTSGKGKCGRFVCVCDEIAARQAERNKKTETAVESKSQKTCISSIAEKCKCGRLVCVCAEIAARQAQAHANKEQNQHEEVCSCSEASKIEIKSVADVVKSPKESKTEKSPVRFKTGQECSEDAKEPKSASRKVGGGNEACKCVNKSGDKSKCDRQVCVCAEIAERHARAPKGAWTAGGGKENKNVAKISHGDAQEKCICSGETEKSFDDDNKLMRLENKDAQIKSTQTKKSPVHFKNQECCTCSEDVKATKKVSDTNEACKCMSKTGDKGKCDRQVCVCAEIAERHARAQKGAWTAGGGKESLNVPKISHGDAQEKCICSGETEKSIDDDNKLMRLENQDAQIKSTQTKKVDKPPVQFKNQECCTCSEDVKATKKVSDTNETCKCVNKSGDKGKCDRQVCVCAEIAERHTRAQKGAWTTGGGKENKNVAKISHGDAQEKCICSGETEKSFDDDNKLMRLENKDALLKSTQTKKVDKPPVQFKNQECCTCSEDVKATKKVSDTNETCKCVNKSGDKGKCDRQVCVCAEIAERHARAQKGAWTAGGGKENKNVAKISHGDAQEKCICSGETEKSIDDDNKLMRLENQDAQIKSTQTKKVDKPPVQFKNQECCTCSEDVKATKKVSDTNETCKCVNKSGDKGKCDRQVCVCAEIAERHARAQKGAWTAGGGKESLNVPNISDDNAQKNCICSEITEKSIVDKAEMCAEKKDPEVKSTQTRNTEKSPARLIKSEECCICSKTSKKVGDDNEACKCVNKIGDKGKCDRQVCVCAEIAERHARAQKGPWTPRNTHKENQQSVEDKPKSASTDVKNVCVCNEETGKASEEKNTQTKSAKPKKSDKSPVRFGNVDEFKTTKSVKEVGDLCECAGKESTNSVQGIVEKSLKRDEDIHLDSTNKTESNKSPKIENDNTCICFDVTSNQNIGEACACRNKTGEKGKCAQRLCVCAEIAARQANAKKGEWVPRTKNANSAEEDLETKCLCLHESENKLGETDKNAIEVIATPKEFQTLSFTNIHSSSDRNLSVHTKLVIRKTSNLRRKPKPSHTKLVEDRNFKSSHTKVVEDRNLKWDDICSCPAKPKGDRTTCGDECETCMITLPVIDIAALANDAGGDEFVPCGCAPKAGKAKIDEQKIDETQVNVEKPTVGCPSKCKTKETVVNTTGS